MARRPNVQGDRDNWGAVLNDYLDVSLGEDGTIKEDAVAPVLSPAIAAGTTEAYTALDIWDGFDGTGAAAGSWDATTYAGWIAGIDNILSGQISGGTVVKTDLGVSSDGTSHVYAYEAGEGPARVLLIGGTHGAEIMGQYANMRWFEQFVASNEVSCRQLRHALRVTWIPTLNPAAYRTGRKNANGVDINRNSDLFWALYNDSDPGDGSSQYYKGPSAASEPETQMVATLLDTHDYRVVFDCHNYGDDGDTFMVSPPGSHLLSARTLTEDAYQFWQAVYGTGIDASYLTPNDTQPNLINYANYVMRHQQGRVWSASVLLECSQNLFGSSGQNVDSHMTRAAVRAYAGMIHTYLLAFLHYEGRATATPYTYTYNAYQPSDITIEDNDPHDMELMWRVGDNVSRLDVANIAVAYAPAYVAVDVTGYVRSNGGKARTTFGVSIDGQSLSYWQRSVTCGDGIGDAHPFAINAAARITEVNPDALMPIRVYYDNVIGTGPNIQRVTATVRVTPDTLAHPSPRINGV